MQAAEAEHEWVLCLDDDVMVHPDTLQQLVQGIKYQDAFMATGLPCRQVLCDPLLQGCCVHAQHAHSCGFACLLHQRRRPSMHASHMHAGSWVFKANTAPAQVKPSNSGKHRCSKDLHSACSLLSASCLGVCCHALAWRKKKCCSHRQAPQLQAGFVAVPDACMRAHVALTCCTASAKSTAASPFIHGHTQRAIHKGNKSCPARAAKKAGLTHHRKPGSQCCSSLWWDQPRHTASSSASLA